MEGNRPRGRKAEAKPAKPRHPRHMVNPNERQEFYKALQEILTPEQYEKLRNQMAERRERRGVPQQAPQCAPTQQGQ